MEEITLEPKFKANFQQLNQFTYLIFIENEAGTKFVSPHPVQIPRPPTEEECVNFFKQHGKDFIIELDILDITKV